MIKIYDCSNSSKRPKHRGPKGIIENTVVTALKTNNSGRGCVFVDKAKDADVIFTNDVFDKKYPKHFKVKRMDGVFLDPKCTDRNVPLNKAAKEADHVIFISKFSEQSYFKNLYDRVPGFYALKSFSIIENWVDSNLFYPNMSWHEGIRLAACCSDWERSEKRLRDIVQLASIDRNVQIYIFGHTPNPKYISMMGCHYIGPMPNFLWASCLKTFDGFINLSHRDPCPKVVIEAIASGLPVLAAKSGGTKDLDKYGAVSFINDLESLEVNSENVLHLDEKEVFNSYKVWISELSNNKIKALDWAIANNRNMFNIMLDKYFEIFTKI